MNQENNNFNVEGNNVGINNQSLNQNQIVGYNTQTGEPIYATNNINNNPKIIGYNTQTGEPIYENNNINKMQNIRYATLSDRLLAAFSDLLSMIFIIMIVFFVFTILLVVLKSMEMEESLIYKIINFIQVGGSVLFIMIGYPLYAFLGEISGKHTAKGKLKHNIYVVDKNSNYLTVGQSFTRMIIKCITFLFPLLIVVNVILVFCTEKKQTLYDLILGHYVVKK